jgi:hypothetical protein
MNFTKGKKLSNFIQIKSSLSTHIYLLLNDFTPFYTV